MDRGEENARKWAVPKYVLQIDNKTVPLTSISGIGRPLIWLLQQRMVNDETKKDVNIVKTPEMSCSSSSLGWTSYEKKSIYGRRHSARAILQSVALIRESIKKLQRL